MRNILRAVIWTTITFYLENTSIFVRFYTLQYFMGKRALIFFFLQVLSGGT